MKILGIDPGNIHSAYVVYDTDAHALLSKGRVENSELSSHVMHGGGGVHQADYMAIEYMHSMGMPQSQEVLDTHFYAGRLVQMWVASRDGLTSGEDWWPIKRREVKLTICGHPRAKDKNIRQAVLDMFPASGGGKIKQVGTKKEPGPLYGVSNDMWSALAIAITANRMHNNIWREL